MKIAKRKYTHWLSFDPIYQDKVKVAVEAGSGFVIKRLYSHPTDMTLTVMEIESEVPYNDLDLDVNSMSSRIKRMTRKPSGLSGGLSVEGHERIYGPLGRPKSSTTQREREAGMMKRWLEDISVELGHDGEINDEVLAEGRRREKIACRVAARKLSVSALKKALSQDRWTLDRRDQSIEKRTAEYGDGSLTVEHRRHTGLKEEVFRVTYYVGDPKQRWKSRMFNDIKEAVKFVNEQLPKSEEIFQNELSSQN